MTTLFSADRVSSGSGPLGEALLVDAGKVVAVGLRSELVGGADEEYRYEGASIIPGLRDAHIHPVGYAAALIGTTLGSIGDLDELTSTLRAAASRLPAGVALVATRFDDHVVTEQRLPTRMDLDRAVPDRPALVHRYCGHIAIANSKALSAAGIDASTPDPDGGSLDRDDVGAPTGVVRETAIDLVTPYLETAVQPGSEQLLEALMKLAGLGITSIGGMLGLGEGPWASLGDEVEAMVAISEDLPLKVHGLVIARARDDVASAEQRIAAAGPRLHWGGLKLFADGSLGGHTAAMHAPFADAPEEIGTMRLTDRDLDLIDHTADSGSTVAVHAIGDRANTAVLDHFETVLARGVRPERLRLEHASVLTPEDVHRIGRMGITASVQPAFIGSETSWLGARVGEERLATTYPFASLLAAGATLAGGSDSPVESPDPFAGMALARDREGMTPEQGLEAEDALGMFTEGGARALDEPPPLGVGSPADFVVVDRDPLQVSADELRATQVIATVVDGAEVDVDRTQPFWVG